ncbi:MAG: Rrf2 family transcriptional regulator, partial [Gammaproteobacteria bacterium]
MKLTTKGRYGVTAMLDLALNAGDGPVTLAAIARRQGISLSYLEQLFTRLRKQELVVSARGPGGGYSLCKPAHEIAVGDVIIAVDEKVDAAGCNDRRNCDSDTRCLTHDLWHELSKSIRDFLNSISLGELLEERNVLDVACRQNSRKQQVGKTAENGTRQA